MGLTIDQVAWQMRCCTKTARLFVRAWVAAQATNPAVPRVTRQKPGPGTRGGHPSYRIDAASFERWRTTGDAAIAA